MTLPPDVNRSTTIRLALPFAAYASQPTPKTSEAH